MVILFYIIAMDLNLYCDFRENFNHCDTRDFKIKYPIKNIMYDHMEWLRELDQYCKLRPCILDNIEKMLLCNTILSILVTIVLNALSEVMNLSFLIFATLAFVMLVVLNMLNN